MKTTWVLFMIFVASNGGVATDKIEYSHEVACNMARDGVIAHVRSSDLMIWAYCVPRT